MTNHTGHHYIYGVLKDILSGKSIIDTDDERIRQEIISLLLEEKEFSKEDLRSRDVINTSFNHQVISTIDLVINILNKDVMIIRYAPGSLVSRERSAIAAARVLNPNYIIPFTIVTNGRDAELLDTMTGKVIKYGMGAIPKLSLLKSMVKDLVFKAYPGNHKEKEYRILNAFDIDRCCK
ncbi:MAG: type I restriction enzyme HsdR N-terminal domain-containing protein [Desulfotalea sp.]